jgi:hypothetical protein
MLVVLVMHMPMFVGQLLVAMVVFVALRQVKPDAEGHEQTGANELDRHRLPQNEYSDQPAEEWCQREVRPGSSRPDVSQGNDKEHQADTVAGKPDGHSGTERAEWWEDRTEPEGDTNVHHSRHTPLQ